MQWFQDFKVSAAKKLARFNNSTFSKAAMSACALITAADGKIEDSERKKVAAFIGNTEMLKGFDGSELGASFTTFCDMATDDFKRIDLLNLVRKCKGNDEQADTLMKVALLIANADGVFAEEEKKVVRELCGVLGLPAETYLTA